MVGQDLTICLLETGTGFLGGGASGVRGQENPVLKQRLSTDVVAFLNLSEGQASVSCLSGLVKIVLLAIALSMIMDHDQIAICPLISC